MREHVQDDRGMALVMATFLMAIALISLGLMTARLVNHGNHTARYVSHLEAYQGIQAAIAMSEDELANGEDGQIGVEDWDPADGLPDFSAAAVDPLPLGETGVEYFAYVRDWATDGEDNLGDGLIDEGPEISFRSIHAFARQKGVVRTATVLHKQEESHSIWDYALFGGPGKAGTPMIDKPVKIMGGVYLDGSNTNPGAVVFNLAAGYVLNSYQQLSSVIENLVSAPPGTTFEGESVQTLNARLHVKKGMVGLWSPATMGLAQDAGNGYKETLDGAYVTDGWVGDTNPDGLPQRLHSDVVGGTDADADLTLPFPTFDNDSGRNHRNYFLQGFSKDQNTPYKWKSGNMDIKLGENYYWNANAGLEVKNKNPGSGGMPSQADVQALIDANQYFIWFNSSTNQMVINGRIAVDGNVSIKAAHLLDTVLYYDGRGSIMAMDPVNSSQGDISIEAHVIPRNLNGSSDGTFPHDNLLALMAGGKVVAEDAPLMVFVGAIYAGAQFEASALLSHFVGSFTASYFKTNYVPTFCHVPDLKEAFTPDMRVIGATGQSGFVKIAYSESQ